MYYLRNFLRYAIDECSSGQTHLVGVFASSLASDQRGFETRLLTCSTLTDGSRLDADEHAKFHSYILQFYCKSWQKIVRIIGDNENTNKSILDKLGIPLIG